MKPALKHILYVAFFVVVCIPARSQQKNTAFINQKIEEAKTLYRKSNYEGAIQLLSQLLAQAQAGRDAYGIAIISIKKSYYEFEAGNSLLPEWNKLEQLVNTAIANRSYLMMELLNFKGHYYKARKDGINRAAQYVEEGIKVAGNPPKNSIILGELYHTLAYIKEAGGDRLAATGYYWKAIRIFEQLRQPYANESLYSDLANCYFLMGEKEKAIELGNTSIALSRRNENYENLGIQLSNLARMYQLSGNSEKALSYFQESFQYTSKAARKETRFVSLVDVALLYHSKKIRDSALKYMEEAIDLGKELKRANLHRYIRLAAMFAGYADNESLMSQYYDESYALAKAAGDKDALRDWYGSLAHYYASVKKDSLKAYPYLVSFHAYKDSLLNEKSKKDFNELEVRYETEKKQAEIIKLANEQKIQQLELDKKNALLKGNVIEAEQKEKEIQLLTQEKTISQLKIEEQNRSLSLNEAQIKNLQQQQKIAEQEGLLTMQKISNEQLKRNLIVAILGATVIAFILLYNRMQFKKKLEQKNLLLQERNRISTELHDEVGSTLTAINLLSHATINQLASPNNAAPRRQVEKIKENTQSVMDNISDIVWSMNPDNDNMQQVVIRMKEFAASLLEQQSIQYRFRISDSVYAAKMSSEVRRDFYLVFKEAVHNLAKYATADNVDITIEKQGKDIILSVQDDGTGFDAENVRKGNGIKNMKMRTEKHNGHFEVIAEKGTLVTAGFPYT